MAMRPHSALRRRRAQPFRWVLQLMALPAAPRQEAVELNLHPAELAAPAARSAPSRRPPPAAAVPRTRPRRRVPGWRQERGRPAWLPAQRPDLDQGVQRLPGRPDGLTRARLVVDQRLLQGARTGLQCLAQHSAGPGPHRHQVLVQRHRVAVSASARRGTACRRRGSSSRCRHVPR